MSTMNEKAAGQHVDSVDDGRKGSVSKEANVASVALHAAVEAQKPSIWSRNMLKLYMIMGIGYLVSTMNGFGKKGLKDGITFFLLTHMQTPP